MLTVTHTGQLSNRPATAVPYASQYQIMTAGTLGGNQRARGSQTRMHMPVSCQPALTASTRQVQRHVGATAAVPPALSAACLCCLPALDPWRGHGRRRWTAHRIGPNCRPLLGWLLLPGGCGGMSARPP
jgi:hypothetical protein